MKLFTLAAAFAGSVYACPNDCAGHGVCGEATQCECYRNWFGADCSERICTYAHAFVDTPVGDLNGDGEHGPARYFDPRTNTKTYGIDFVGGGQSELYAWQYGYARGTRTTAHDEAHFYRECANKGVCDRTTGQCACFPGYEGEGCSRTSCPLDCSGHGKCRTLADANLVMGYSAWDAEQTQDCICDPGYSGPACQMRDCPRGADPVEYALSVTNSVQGIFWSTFLGAAATVEAELAYAADKPSTVYYTLTYQDEYGDDFTTSLLSVEYSSVCDGAFCMTTPDFATQSLEEHAESVNNSLAALSMGAIENHYTWTVGQDFTNNGDGTLSVNPTADGLLQGEYPKDATSPKSVFVEALAYRLDANVVPVECTVGDNTPGATSTVFGLCTFVQIENPGVQAPLTVQYFYVPKTTTSLSGLKEFDVISGESGTFAEAYDTSDPTQTVLLAGGYDGDVTDGKRLVFVENLQPVRQWNAADGDVALDFLQTEEWGLGVCSKRGLCDYDTGMCDCFSGYSGLRCDDQNAIAFSY